MKPDKRTKIVEALAKWAWESSHMERWTECVCQRDWRSHETKMLRRIEKMQEARDGR